MSDLHALGSSGGVSPSEPVQHDEGPAPASRWLEILIACCALALSLLALYLSRSIHLKMGGGGIDPKWWPTVLSCFALALSVGLCLKAVFGAKVPVRDCEAAHYYGWWRLVVTLGLGVVHILIWKQVGFIWPTPFYLFALLWLYGIRNWKPLILHPLLTTATIWVLFQYLLRVPL